MTCRLIETWLPIAVLGEQSPARSNSRLIFGERPRRGGVGFPRARGAGAVVFAWGVCVNRHGDGNGIHRMLIAYHPRKRPKP